MAIPWWLGWSKIHLQCRRPEFNPWVRKIPWRMDWQPPPVFLLREFKGQRSLPGLQSMGSQRVGHDRATDTFTSLFYFFIFGGVTGNFPGSFLFLRQLLFSSLGPGVKQGAQGPEKTGGGGPSSGAGGPREAAGSQGCPSEAGPSPALSEARAGQ